MRTPTSAISKKIPKTLNFYTEVIVQMGRRAKDIIRRVKMKVPGAIYVCWSPPEMTEVKVNVIPTISSITSNITYKGIKRAR